MTNDFYINSNYFVKIKSAEIVYNNEAIRISPKYFDILLFLINNKNEVVSRETLFKEIWGETIVVDESLTRAISELRKIFATHNDNNIIETIPKKGYRFKGDISFNAPLEIVNRKKSKYKPFLFVAVPAVLIVLLAFKFIKFKEKYTIDSNVIPLTSYRGSEIMPFLADNGNDLLLIVQNNDKFADGLYLKIMNTEEIVPVVLGSNISEPQFINNSSEIIYLLSSDTSCSFIITSRLGQIKRTLFSVKEKVLSYKVNSVYDIVYLANKSINFVHNSKVNSILISNNELIHNPFFDLSETKIYFFLRTEHFEKFYTYNIPLNQCSLTHDLTLKTLDYASVLNSKELLIVDKTQIYRYDLADNELERFYFLPHQFNNINYNLKTKVLTFNESQSNINIWTKAVDKKEDPTLRIESTMLDQNPLSSESSDNLCFISTRCGNYNIWSSENNQALARPITTYKSGYISELFYDKLKNNIYFIRFAENLYFLNKVNVASGTIGTLKTSDFLLRSLIVLENDNLLLIEENKDNKKIISFNTMNASESTLLDNTHFTKIYKTTDSNLIYAVKFDPLNVIYSYNLKLKKESDFYKTEKIIESVLATNDGLVLGFKAGHEQHLFLIDNNANLTDLNLSIPLESTYSINQKNIYYSQNDRQESDIFALQFKVY